MLALLLDQVIRLLPAPTANEDRHWYLQTVQYHPLLGWSGYPNFVGTKDGIPIQTNSRGYRDREPVDVEDGHKPGVLFLGDSFTWGDEVRLEERFTSLLEASCGLVCDRLSALRAINKGIIGYGTAQSLLDYTLAREGRPFEAVILALYHGERPHRQRRGGQSQRPTAPVDSLRAEDRRPEPLFRGRTSSPGYRLA